MDNFEDMLPHVQGKFLRKRRHPARPLNDIDPEFNTKFDPELHGEDIKELQTAHLPSDIASELIALVKEFWCVFDKRGLLVPVKDYECVIDTGNHPPIACRNPNYGHHEIPIMKDAIGKLLELNQTKQVLMGHGSPRHFLLQNPIKSTLLILISLFGGFASAMLPSTQSPESLHSLSLIVMKALITQLAILKYVDSRMHPPATINSESRKTVNKS